MLHFYRSEARKIHMQKNIKIWSKDASLIFTCPAPVLPSSLFKSCVRKPVRWLVGGRHLPDGLSSIPGREDQLHKVNLWPPHRQNGTCDCPRVNQFDDFWPHILFITELFACIFILHEILREKLHFNVALEQYLSLWLNSRSPLKFVVIPTTLCVPNICGISWGLWMLPPQKKDKCLKVIEMLIACIWASYNVYMYQNKQSIVPYKYVR